MKITKITAIYFSPTNNTKKIVCQIAHKLADIHNVQLEEIDITQPQNRLSLYEYTENDLIVFGMPVYAGRLPNKLLPFVKNNFVANNALAIPIVSFGNRSFDNALIELRNELESNGFNIVGAASLVAEHAFSSKLANGRPNKEDLSAINTFVENLVKKNEEKQINKRIYIPGDNPVVNYYTPLGIDDKPAVFLKAKPMTNTEKCLHCNLCAKLCPMESICTENTELVTGICIKCQACIKKCPVGAKYFDDKAFLSHIEMLEKNYSRRAENSFFL